MNRPAPILLDTMPVAELPASRAWNALGGATPTRVELWRRARSKPGIYRLLFSNPRRPAVFAKNSRSEAMLFECALYREILLGLPGAAPGFLGTCMDPDGSTWLFIESVGDRRLSEANGGHRVLAGEWLGRLHGAAAVVAAASRLPDAGPNRYLAHLRAGRDGIRGNFANPALTHRDRAVLTGLLEALDGLESRWGKVDTACAGFPVTLVHGDLRPKNVRIRGGAAAAVHAIDWEMAGWGIPAADLASACGPGPTVPIDSQAYRDAARGHGMDLDATAIHRLSVLGRIFQALAGTEWASSSLRFDTSRYLLGPMSSMRVFLTQIERALGEAVEWLG